MTKRANVSPNKPPKRSFHLFYYHTVKPLVNTAYAPSINKNMLFFEKISRKLRQNTVLFTIFVTVTNINKAYVD